jgi:pSer/pThr/pTyr-binding forkhead associated (FHA) protein
MAKLLLEIVEGPEAGRKLDLGGPVEIGRGAGPQLVLDGDGQISRRHARVEPSAEGAVLTDLGSRNGTYVNEQPVHRPRALGPGDRFRVGLTVIELRAEREVESRPSAVAPVPEVTRVDAGVLQPASPEELRGSQVFSAQELEAAGIPAPAAPPPTPAAPAPFAPGRGAGEPPADDAYAALVALVDTRVKRRTNIAVFAILATAGLAVLILLGSS